MKSALETCPGCGLESVDADGPLHVYVVTSAGCWRLFGQAQTLPVERLFVDAYMAQHPGGESPQQTQSVAAHLIVLDAVLRRNQPVARASDIARGAIELGRRAGGYPKLNEPVNWKLTVAEVVERPGRSKEYVVSVLDEWLQNEPPELEKWTAGALGIVYGSSRPLGPPVLEPG